MQPREQEGRPKKANQPSSKRRKWPTEHGKASKEGQAPVRTREPLRGCASTPTGTSPSDRRRRRR
eukprot:13160224-Heterocapsa_arctica.AAC.1